MSGTFVIRNQLGHYLGKSGGWVKGGRPGQVACWTHHDEAVNTLFELGSKETDLRGEILLAETEDKRPKNLELSHHPVPKTGNEKDLETHQDDPIA